MLLEKIISLFQRKPSRLDSCDFTLFTDTKHHLSMLGMSYEDLIVETENLFSLQIPETKLSEIRLINPPHWLLTTGKEDSNGLSPLRRAACALDFSCLASAPNLEVTALNFILSFSFVDIGLPTVNHQFWIDVNGTLDDFGKDGELIGRLFRLESKTCTTP